MGSIPRLATDNWRKRSPIGLMLGPGMQKMNNSSRPCNAASQHASEPAAWPGVRVNRLGVDLAGSSKVAAATRRRAGQEQPRPTKQGEERIRTPSRQGDGERGCVLTPPPYFLARSNFTALSTSRWTRSIVPNLQWNRAKNRSRTSGSVVENEFEATTLQVPASSICCWANIKWSIRLEPCIRINNVF